MKLGDKVIIQKRVLDDLNKWHEPGEEATVKVHAASNVQVEFAGCVFNRGRAVLDVKYVEVKVG